MKTVVLILLVVGAVLLGHNYLQTGKIGFNVSLSEDERAIRALDDRLTDAVRSYKVAGRGAAVGGVADGSAAENAAAEVQRVGRELSQLEERIKDPALQDDLKALGQRVRSTKSQMGIP